MIRAGLQIPNFTYEGVGSDQLFEKVADLATTAERSGFDTVLVMDHFFQLPMMGEPSDNMLESYTLLGALAARTERVNLGTLVTGVTYRNPALLAKIVTTLDVISKGRAFLGIGAAWFDVEHHALGFDFPPLKERYERLEEALQITRAMFRGEDPTIEGKHYQVRQAFNAPAPVRDGGPPIMIGGSGEKKTMPLMARYADLANVIADLDQAGPKIDALRAACEAEGRDIDTINKTPLVFLVCGDTTADAEAKRDAGLAARGLNWDDLDDATRAMLTARMVVGDRDHATERLKGMLDAGYDGIIVNLPLDGADTTAVERAGAVIADALA